LTLFKQRFEGQGHRSKFTVTGGNVAIKVVGATSSDCFLLLTTVKMAGVLIPYFNLFL